MRNKYIDEKERILYVCHYYKGYAAVYRNRKGRNFDEIRLDIPELPVRDTWKQAQEDLDRYAKEKKLQAYGDKETCKYFYGLIKNGNYDYIQCGTRTFLCFADEGKLKNIYSSVCYGDHTRCRAYCVRILNELGFEPQSYWDTEMMQQLLNTVTGSSYDAFKALNDLQEDV